MCSELVEKYNEARSIAWPLTLSHPVGISKSQFLGQARGWPDTLHQQLKEQLVTVSTVI